MRTLLRRLLYLLRYREEQDALAEELEFHRAMKQQELLRDGIDSATASAIARRSLGNELSSRQAARDVWIAPRIQEIYQDIRFAARLLAKDRGFAATATLVLGLGIGVNNMMFTLIYTHTMRSLPIPDAGRVLYISTIDERTPDRPLSYPELVDIRTASTFEGIAAYASTPMTVGDDGRAPDRFEGAYITANAMDVIGVAPVLGRAFTAAEETPGAPRVAMLGSNAWRLRYGSDRSILGRTILVNGAPATVVGVMPARSGFPITLDVWLPLSQMPGITPPRRDARTLRVFGRLREGVGEAAARTEIESIIDRTSRAQPGTSGGVRARVVSINERFLGRPTDPAWLAFFTASFIVVVVSAANAANLMIARSALRTREIAIRTSLGASRSRIVRQMLTESVVLAAVGGVVALGVSLAGVRAFKSLIPENTLPYWIDYAMDTRVLGALIAVSFATVLLFGLVPAVQSSRTDVNQVLKDGGRAGTGTKGSRRWTTLFLTAQFALTVVLLVNGVVAIRTRGPQVPSDTIVKTTDIVTAAVTLPPASYPTPAQRVDFLRRLDERLRSVPGITGVSTASVLPSRVVTEQRVEFPESPQAVGENAPTVRSVSVGPRYFETLALPLQRGREFDWNDGEPGRAHAIVNQRFVEIFLPHGEPIGRRMRLVSQQAGAADDAWLTIIGVAQNIRQRPTPTADPLVYLPLRSASPSTVALIVRGTADAATQTNRLRDELHRLDSNLPLYRSMTMAKAIEEAEWNGRVSTRLLLSITLLVLVLSVVGLYAVTAHAVTQRHHEIGIRMAIGATPWQVRWFVLRRAFVQVGIGLLIGILCTSAWDAAFSTGVVDLRFASAGNLAPVAALLSLTVLLACFVPARRATRLDPVAALRSE